MDSKISNKWQDVYAKGNYIRLQEVYYLLGKDCVLIVFDKERYEVVQYSAEWSSERWTQQ